MNFSDARITEPERQTMLALLKLRADGRSIRNYDVAAKIKKHKSSASRALKSLLDKGFVEKYDSVYYRLTRRGKNAAG